MGNKIILVLSFLLMTLLISGQQFNEKEPADTIHLHTVNWKKSVAYKIDSATILVEYSDFMKSFEPFQALYQKNVNKGRKQKNPAKQVSPYYIKRAAFLDSTYRRLTAESRLQDTVYINYMSFAMADIGTGFDFSSAVESGNCILLNQLNIRQAIVLRQFYAHQRGPLNGWGGWLYFIPGSKMPFLTKTKWSS
jgi:hypothetical protein